MNSNFLKFRPDSESVSSNYEAKMKALCQKQQQYAQKRMGRQNLDMIMEPDLDTSMEESFGQEQLSEYEQKAMRALTFACIKIQSWFKMLLQKAKYKETLKKKEINAKLELQRALSAMDKELLKLKHNSKDEMATKLQRAAKRFLFRVAIERRVYRKDMLREAVVTAIERDYLRLHRAFRVWYTLSVRQESTGQVDGLPLQRVFTPESHVEA